MPGLVAPSPQSMEATYVSVTGRVESTGLNEATWPENGTPSVAVTDGPDVGPAARAPLPPAVPIRRPIARPARARRATMSVGRTARGRPARPGLDDAGMMDDRSDGESRDVTSPVLVSRRVAVEACPRCGGHMRSSPNRSMR